MDIDKNENDHILFTQQIVCRYVVVNSVRFYMVWLPYHDYVFGTHNCGVHGKHDFWAQHGWVAGCLSAGIVSKRLNLS